MLFHLGYVSTETQPMLADDLAMLLRQASARNRALGITGLLLHREDSFFQVLEGDAESVHQVFEAIQRDPRHHRIQVLFEGPLATREFASWQMGFVELDGVDVDQLPGFSDFLFKKAEPRRLLKELTQAKRLMLLFRAMH